MQLGGLVFLMYFLPIFLMLEYFVPEKRKTVLLIVANIIFYALAGWQLLEFLLAVSIFNYFSAFGIEKHRDKKLYYWIPFVINMMFLVWKGHMAGFGRLPVAAFFTLEASRYLCDVYGERKDSEKNFLHFFLFLSYFPVSQAGPVREYRRIEFDACDISPERKRKGIKIFIEGLAMQSVLGAGMADLTRRILYDSVFRGAHLDLAFVWMGAFAGGFYVYFTLCGACRMAKGLSEILSIDLPSNFDYPLLCVSITAFMERFNGTLTDVFRKGIAEPLEGRLKKRMTIAVQGMIFLLIGNLYGFRLMSFVWGGYLFLIWYLESRVLKTVVDKVPKPVKAIFTVASVAAGWIILLAPDVSGALFYLGQMVGIGTNGLWSPECIFFLTNRWYIWLFAFLSATPALKFLRNRQTFIKEDGGAEAAVYILLLLVSVSYMFSGNDVSGFAAFL